MRPFNDCSWNPILRWLTFFPLGLLASGIVQAYLRWANTELPLTAEVLARAVEPWIFFFISLWILPKYNRVYLVIAAAAFILINIGTIYMVAYKQGFSQQPWADNLLSAIAILSCLGAVYYFNNKSFSENSIHSNHLEGTS